MDRRAIDRITRTHSHAAHARTAHARRRRRRRARASSIHTRCTVTRKARDCTAIFASKNIDMRYQSVTFGDTGHKAALCPVSMWTQLGS